MSDIITTRADTDHAHVTLLDLDKPPQNQGKSDHAHATQLDLDKPPQNERKSVSNIVTVSSTYVYTRLLVFIWSLF